jgi:hypothetical protein
VSTFAIETAIRREYAKAKEQAYAGRKGWRPVAHQHLVRALRMRSEVAFLADLQAVFDKHGMYIDAWAQYADDSFFGIEHGKARLGVSEYQYSHGTELLVEVGK